MDGWKKDGRRDVMITDLDTLIPQDHLLRKIEKVMDYDWLYERLSPYYCADNCWHSVWKLEFVGIGLSDSIKQAASSFCGRNPVLFSRANVGAASVDKKMRLVLK